MWRAYLSLLDRRPLLTKALTASALLGVGDVLGQLVLEKGEPGGKKSLDVIRVARSMSIGLFVSGPLMHFWYKLLDTTIKTGTRGVLTKVVLDQTLFAPVIVSAFFACNGLFQGQSPSEISRKIRADLPHTMLMNWTIWPAAMLINFKFVPPSQRVLYASSVALLWNVYLTTASNRKLEEKAH